MKFDVRRGRGYRYLALFLAVAIAYGLAAQSERELMFLSGGTLLGVLAGIVYESYLAWEA